MQREIANFFWHGTLSKFEEVCIKSFVDKGFNVNLWSYTNLKVEGVTSRDAREILPEDDLSKYKTSATSYLAGKNKAHTSIAIFSDVFRVKLATLEKGWWVDADCYCMKDQSEFKKLRENKSWVYALEYFNVDHTGSSIFYMSKPIAKIFKNELELKLNNNNNIAKNFIDFGPILFSEVCIKHKMYDGLLPSHTFFPIYWKNRHWLVEPYEAEKAKCEIKESYAVHIWASTLIERGYEKESPPSGSVIHSFFNNLDVTTNDNSKQVLENNEFLDRFIGVNKLYNTLLYRSADISGLTNYIRSNRSLEDIKNSIINSEEYKLCQR